MCCKTINTCLNLICQKQKNRGMNRGSTIFLRLVIVMIAVGALAICLFALPAIAAQDAAAHPELAWQRYPFLAYAFLLCLIFLIALYQCFKLLGYVDANIAFSELSVRALKYVKYCGMSISGLIIAGLATLMILAVGKNEDITGIVMPGIVVTFISGVGATIVTVLQSHVQKAIELKSENDLTV